VAPIHFGCNGNDADGARVRGVSFTTPPLPLLAPPKGLVVRLALFKVVAKLLPLWAMFKPWWLLLLLLLLLIILIWLKERCGWYCAVSARQSKHS